MSTAPPPAEGRPRRTLAPAPIKLYTQMGQMAKDVLYGNRAEGLYGVAGASKFSVASVTSSGVSITTTATSSPSGALTGQLLAAYSPAKTGWLGELLITTGGLAEATFSKDYTPPPIDLAGADGRDGQRQAGGNGSGSSSKLVLGTFRLGGVVALPTSATGAPPLPKLTLDYTGRNLHLKTTATFTAKPLITAMGVMGAGKVALGGDVSYDSRTAKLTRWGTAAAWHDAKQQVGMQLSGNGRTATLLYGYSISPGVTLGLEAVSDVTLPTRGISGGAVAAAGGVPVEAAAAEGSTAAAPKATGSGFRLSPPVTALGASFRLPSAKAGGGYGAGTFKVKVDSAGVVSVLYRDELAAGPRVTLTAQLDSTNLSKAPRLGINLDV